MLRDVRADLAAFRRQFEDDMSDLKSCMSRVELLMALVKYDG